MDLDRQSGRFVPDAGGLVSVVIPTYNHARYLGDAIASVLSQTYQRFEIIVVDDGSTDDTRQVVGLFRDRVRYVWQENRGLSAARNAGIRLASGEYVGVLDADDMYEPTFMATLTRELEDNPGAMAVYCGYRFVDDGNTPLPQVEARHVPPDHVLQALVDGNFLVPESILVRRRCYEAVGPFDESLGACEDLDMWLRIARQFQVVGTTGVLTRHRVLPASMSADPERMRLNRFRVCEKNFGPELADPAAMTPVQRRAYGRAYLGATIEHLQSRRDARAGDLFRRMSEVCPDLLLELGTFYELGCGIQPKGYRGDFASLDLVGNARVMQDMLRSALASDRHFAGRRSDERRIWAKAYFALGLLHYGKRERSLARAALLRAIAHDPQNILDHQLTSVLVKSCLPAGLIDWCRRRKLPLAAPARCSAVRPDSGTRR